MFEGEMMTVAQAFARCPGLGSKKGVQLRLDAGCKTVREAMAYDNKAKGRVAARIRNMAQRKPHGLAACIRSECQSRRVSAR